MLKLEADITEHEEVWRRLRDGTCVVLAHRPDAGTFPHRTRYRGLDRTPVDTSGEFENRSVGAAAAWRSLHGYFGI